MIVTGVDAETAEVVSVNVAVVEPAGMVTVAGGTTLWPFVDKLTVVPPVGAGEPRVRVPVEEVPPTTEVGDTVKPTRPVGESVSVAV